jgi:hypothetical protein
MKANGVPVALSDVPARNGVYHFIPRLINPLHHHKHRENGDGEGGDFDENEDDWMNWREWLPQWADEE